MYGRLAKSEEAAMAAQFGEEYVSYARRTPRFLPRLGPLPAGEEG